jgi:uncharacterized protein YrrD
MELKEGTSVYAPDGREVGKINRFVLDPATKQITHIVVQKGWLLPEDKVVQIEMIRSAAEDRVELNELVKDYNELPPFEETHFVSADEEEEYGESASRGIGYYWYPPMGYVGSPFGPTYYNPPLEKQQNIPENTVPLKEGADVISADEKHVGDLERLIIDSDTNKITHFVISQGLLLKERKLVPAQWVRSVEEDKVYLTVSARLLERLPVYEEHAPERE